MATFEEGFLYPLILLVVGAGLTSLLIPWFTKRWEEQREKQREKEENRKKELEIKVDIASKMSEVIAHQTANTFTSLAIQKKEFKESDRVASYNDLKEWYVKVNTVGSTLESYFPETGIRKKWDAYTNLVMVITHATRQYFYENPPQRQLESYEVNLNYIKEYFSDNPIATQNLPTVRGVVDDFKWHIVNGEAMKRGEEIIKEVLKLPIKVF